RSEVADAVPLSGRNRDHVVADAAAREGRHLDRAGRALDPEDVARPDAETLGGGEADFGPAVPCHVRDGVRNLLEEGQRRTAAVAEEGMGEREQGQLALA